jgi:hypothetical protein
MPSRIWPLALAALLLSAPLSAHHAAIMFDMSTAIRVKGTVVRVTWANPHSAIVIEEKTQDGKAIRWALESSAPIHMLEERGFSKDSFTPGDVVEACGFPPKTSGSPRPNTAVRGRANPGPAWLDGTDRVITARLLVSRDGRHVDWSHYGPLELCIGKP